MTGFEYDEYDPASWFWYVQTLDQYWSSQARAFVEAGAVDPRRLTRIDTLENLADVLEPWGIRCMVRQKDVIAERARRLSAGFEYDFGNGRGVHRIGTTPEDREGWNRVSELAQAMINLGQGAAPINVLTDTGHVTITAQEWQQILLAAGAFEQPIWHSSFALLAMNPIPDDYEADHHWTPAP